ncbi:MAG: glycosyltransferase family 2 protein [Desulfuromusa sp.]|nr:glycosyltransferase family 2 protein [Desulfuromusa sp.]
MSDIPVISIVTPSYNQGEFLEETLVSVLSQEGDFELDYLVIDGGSSDASPELIKSYAERLEAGDWPVRCRGIRYRWVSEPDRGQTAALLKGFAMAEGGILAWLNSDDVYLPGVLQTAIDRFQADPETALLYGEAQYCDTEGEIIGNYPTEEFNLEKLAWFNFFCQPATFFRKEVYAAVGGLDANLHYGMDYDLFVRIGKRYRCSLCREVLAKYRLHESSKTVDSMELYKNHEETLSLAVKHFDWAPLNRVYGASYYACLSRLPEFLIRRQLPLILLSSLYAVPRSLWLNRGVRRADLRLLNRKTLSKLFKDRLDILRG